MTTQTATSTLRLQAAAPSFTVNDLEKSLAFYRDLLGFEVKQRWEQDGKLRGVELAAGDVYLMIGQDDWKKGKTRVKGEGFRVYCTTEQDIDEIARELKARGLKLDKEPIDEGWGRSFDIVDPDGFKITIGKESKKH